jgi:outer membrane protein W
MKRIVLSLATVALAGGMMAQSNQLSFGADVALPMGDFGDFYTLGIGPAVGFELPLGDKLGLTAQVSYMFLTPSSDFSDIVKSSSMLPLQAGLKYYFQESQSGLYAHGQLGVHSTSTTIDLGPLGESTESSSNFSWAIGAGYQLEKFDIGVRYNSISPDSDAGDEAESSTYIGLRVAYLLNLGG